MLFHTGDKRYDYSNPNRLMHVLEAFPQMKVIGAHFGGYTLWEEAAMQLCKKYDNFYVDCSSSLFALSPERGRALIHMYGADRVLFGSDYPLWSPQTEVKRFFELGLTEEENQKILYQNASDLIGITL